MLISLSMAALAAPVCVEVDGGHGCREDIDGWRVLDLHGTDEAIGRTYGELLKSELLSDWMPMVEEMHFARMPPAFRTLLKKHGKHFEHYFDTRASNRARGLEQALALEPGTVERYAWLADLASIGPALQLALGRTVQVDAVTGSVGDRCTSVVASDGDTTLLARNLDFWGMKYWQPHAALVFVEPLDEAGNPDGRRYAQVGTVGELFAGSSGINDAGLAVTSHLHVTRDSALVFGRPRMKMWSMLWEGMTGRHPRGGSAVYVLFEKLLRDAGSVEEAIAILESTPPVGAWSFVVADPTGARAVVGRSYSQMSVARGASVNTNFYFDSAMHAQELHPSRGPLEGTRLRYRRAVELLGDGELTVREATRLLRDRFDTSVGRERATSANSILSPDTSQSVVLVSDPSGDHVLWLARPHEDGLTPAPLARFSAFRFSDGFAPGRTLAGQIPFVDESPQLTQASLPYLEAMHQAHDLQDPSAAAATLRAMSGKDEGTALISAWASGATGDLGAAWEELQGVDRSQLSLHHQALAGWLEGELEVRRGDLDRAKQAWTSARALLSAHADPDCAPMDRPLIAVVENRLAGGWKNTELAFPDLKFQDIVELRLGRTSRRR